MVGRMRRRALPAVVTVALAALTLFVFLQVREHSFIGLDDTRDILGSPQVRAGLSLEGARWAFSVGHPPYWHPLTTLSHMLDVELFGLDAGAHLSVNVALHLTNTLLFLLLIVGTTGRWWTGALAAALFALHPLRVESVAWAAERKDMLSGLFWMTALLAAVRHARRPSLPRLALIAALFGLGLLAKPVLVVLPLAVLAVEFWPLGRLRADGWRLPVLEKVPLALLALPVGLITWLVVRQTTFAERSFPPGERLANAAVSAVAYLGQTIWPANLAIFYPHPASVGRGTPGWEAAGAAILLAAISVLAWRLRRSRPWLLAGWAWYLAVLAPTLGIVQNWEQARADRFTYLPLAGIFWALAEEVRLFAGRSARTRRSVAALATAAVLTLAVVARHQTALWRDPETLFRHALAVTDDNWLAASQLGVVLSRKGRDDEAERLLRQSLALRPLSPIARNNLAIVLDRTGRGEEAAREYAEAIREDPGYAEARVNLGTLLLRKGMTAAAVAEYRGALAVREDYPPAHFNLGLALEAMGNWQEALEHYEGALRAGMRTAIVQERLGLLLERQGRATEAAGHLEEALRLNPGDDEASAALQRLRLVSP